MRTKTLLLACVALAFSLATSQAQVYSQNVVGYANVVLYGAGQYSAVANPFDDGNGNYMTNLFANLPQGSAVLIWNGTVFLTENKTGAGWAAAYKNTQCPPGQGFFVKNSSVALAGPTLTNTFVGNVVVPWGGSVTNQMPMGYTLQGSTVPYAGSIATAGSTGGDPNLNYGGPLANTSKILTWNALAVPQALTTTTKIGTGKWNGAGASINVGDAFFIYNLPGPATSMVQTLP
jgi:hypothetical protein